jgi:hypothetical protein
VQGRTAEGQPAFTAESQLGSVDDTATGARTFGGWRGFGWRLVLRWSLVARWLGGLRRCITRPGAAPWQALGQRTLGDTAECGRRPQRPRPLSECPRQLGSEDGGGGVPRLCRCLPGDLIGRLRGDSPGGGHDGSGRTRLLTAGRRCGCWTGCRSRWALLGDRRSGRRRPGRLWVCRLTVPRQKRAAGATELRTAGIALTAVRTDRLAHRCLPDRGRRRASGESASPSALVIVNDDAQGHLRAPEKIIGTAERETLFELRSQ